MVQENGGAAVEANSDPSSPALLPLNEGAKGERPTLASDAAYQSQEPRATSQEPAPPLWQTISGLFPQAESKMSRSERRHALRKLFKHYEKLAREALAEHAGDAERDERTFLWDPLPMLCVELGIARRKLSMLTKELTGMAAHEVIDKIRAESLATNWRAEMIGFVQEWLAPGNLEREQSNGEYTFRERFKIRRVEAGIENATWAVQSGFSNYARMRRGFMLANKGQTPSGFEWQVFNELAEFFKLKYQVGRRMAFNSISYVDWHAAHVGQPWDDTWTKAQVERPEWLAQMLNLFPLNEEAARMAALTIVPSRAEFEREP